APYGFPGGQRPRRAPPSAGASGGPATGARQRGVTEGAEATPPAPKVGLCGRLTVGQACYTATRGYLAVGEAFRGRPSRSGLLLGRLGGVFGRSALRSRLPTALWGIQKGKADAPSGEPRPLRQASCAARGPSPPAHVTRYLFRPVKRAVGLHPRRTIVTWLILPVVICLSQRLSHACLSISNYTAKLRMAH
ncbi:hypothetical protein QBC40DRAFT_302520, partial [Triangularia verruculosa]